MKVVIAHRFWQRICGMLARRWQQERLDLSRSCVLMIVPCASIHTFGMKAPIDIAFIGADGVVMLVKRQVPPGRIVRCRGAACVLERWGSNTQDWFEQGRIMTIHG